MSRASNLLPLLCASMLTIQVPAQTAPLSPPPAQTSPAPSQSDADQLVDRLVQNTEQYRTTLPSLTAHESIVSKYDEVVFFGKSTYKADATVRMLRKSPDGPLEESRVYTDHKGRPLASGKQPQLPINLVNDFSDLPSDFFSASNRPCFEFTLAPHPDNTPLELRVSRNPDAANLPQCASIPKGRTGIVRVDPATFQITHLESINSTKSTVPNEFFFSLSADYAPTRVGDKIFWLPVTVVMHVVIRKDPMKWVSHYSNYHQFTATATILPVAPE